jgi:hypothetical protein
MHGDFPLIAFRAFCRITNVILATHIYLAHCPYMRYIHTTKANRNSKCCTNP